MELSNQIKLNELIYYDYQHKIPTTNFSPLFGQRVVHVQDSKAMLTINDDDNFGQIHLL